MEQESRIMVNQNSVEQSEARRIGAVPHKNSGRGKLKKGDATWKTFTIDYKHIGKSFSINKAVWAKACTDALKNNADPAIVVVLGEDGEPKTRLAIIELAILEQLLEDE